MNPKLRIVKPDEKPKAPAPALTDAKLKTRIANIRQRLLETATNYVRVSTTGSRPDRIREASSLSGIPITLIEVELKRGEGK